MKKHNKSVPTDSELEILQLLWNNGPMSVRQVNDMINKDREVGYTTTLKIMQIMAEKELVNRDTSSRTHIYTAVHRQESTTSTLLDRFINAAYNGSASKMIMQALGNHKATPDELDQIKSLIKKIERDD